MWKRIKKIFTKSKVKDNDNDFVMSCLNSLDYQNKLHNWAVIIPVIECLDELKKNTWDKTRVTQLQDYLRKHFEVKNDR